MVLHCALAIICVWLGNVEIVILSGIVLVYSLVSNKKVFEYVWCFVACEQIWQCGVCLCPSLWVLPVLCGVSPLVLKNLCWIILSRLCFVWLEPSWFGLHLLYHTLLCHILFSSKYKHSIVSASFCVGRSSSLFSVSLLFWQEMQWLLQCVLSSQVFRQELCPGIWLKVPFLLWYLQF